MANIECQIKPTGVSQKNLVDLLCMLVRSIYGICLKLDSDGGVPLETYVANCYTAIFNGSVEDSRGNLIYNRVEAHDYEFYIIRPTGISFAQSWLCVVQIANMLEALCEQLDTDALTDSNYEALVYAAHFPDYDDDAHNVGNMKNDTQKVLVDLLYCYVHMIDTLTKKLDLDGTVTDTNYHALWDTAVILMQVENSRGSVAGNPLTKFMP